MSDTSGEREREGEGEGGRGGGKKKVQRESVKQLGAASLNSISRKAKHDSCQCSDTRHVKLVHAAVAKLWDSLI